ncbi:MAG: hypothetical protein DMF19_04585, partial [Verrucomicrobia bacterium]
RLRLRQLGRHPDYSAFAYSTYLGGSFGEGANAIAADSAGNAYVTRGTQSTDFPTVDVGVGIAIDTANAYVTGIAYSTDFPTTAGAFRPRRTQSPRPSWQRLVIRHHLLTARRFNPRLMRTGQACSTISAASFQ